MKATTIRRMICLCTAYCQIAFSGQLKLGNDSILEKVVGDHGPPPHPESYYQPIAPGLISSCDVAVLQEVQRRGTVLLADLQEGSQCKQSTWVPKLQTWVTAIGYASDVKTNAAVLDLIPTIADFLAFAYGEDPYSLCEDLEGIKIEMFVSSPIVIRSVAAYIQEKNGNVEPERLASFVKVFSIGEFERDENYTETAVPVSSSGVMILNPAAVTSQLKSMSWKRASQFLGGATAAQAFGRYEASGEGIVVLKSKYAANKIGIIAKWNELAAWVAQQKQGSNH